MLIAQLVGCALLVAAIITVLGKRQELLAGWRAAGTGPGWVIPAVVLLPLANWAITSLIFWMLMRPHGRVGVWEMAALIGSAWLLNMLPLKPGFVGRVAYHKAISGIRVRTTLVVAVVAMLSGSVGIVVALGIQLGLDPVLRDTIPAGGLLPLMIGVVLAAAVAAAVLGWYHGWQEVARHGWPVTGAILLRVVDTHIWALRYYLAFWFIAHEQAYGVCIVIAGVSQIAGQIPIALGVREWTVGMSTPLLDGTPVRSLQTSAAVPGLTTDLLCRAAEIVCAVPVGLVSYAWIYRRMGRARSARLGQKP
jgi:hypothetical protein